MRRLPKVPPSAKPFLWALVLRWLAVVFVAGWALVELSWAWAMLVVGVGFALESGLTEFGAMRAKRRDQE